MPGRATRSNGRTKHVKVNLIRWSVWGVVIILSVSALVVGNFGVNYLFFSGNPHFELKHLDIVIVSGSIGRARVEARIGHAQAEAEPRNIYAMDLDELRQRLLTDPLIQEAEVRRRLPGTIEIRVHGRSAVAQLITRPGRLIDATGVVLPVTDKIELHNLPVITGVTKPDSYATGERLDDNPLLKSALQLLHCRATLKGGTNFDINYIQLVERFHEMRVNLRENVDWRIRDGAVIIFPKDDVCDAFERALAIAAKRSLAEQPWSEMNVTYERRVPVLP